MQVTPTQRLADTRDFILMQALRYGAVQTLMYLSPSRFAAALGICRFTSRKKLWRKMKGLETEPPENPACIYGQQLEPVAIRAYEELTGHKVHPAPSIHQLHRDPPRMGTADGLLDYNGIIEVKCPYSMTLTRHIRPEYWTQIQGYLEYYNRDFCDFIIYTPFTLVVHRAFRDRHYWTQLLTRLQSFLDFIQQNQEPPAMKSAEKQAALDEIRVSMQQFSIPMLFSKCFVDDVQSRHRKSAAETGAAIYRQHKRCRAGSDSGKPGGATEPSYPCETGGLRDSSSCHSHSSCRNEKVRPVSDA